MAEIWIDTDMGSDDAMAIMLAVQHLEVAGLSLVSGNAPIEQVARNASGFSKFLGWQFPVYTGAARPVIGPLETAQHVLGQSALPLRGEEPLFQPVSNPDFPNFLDPLCQYLEGSEKTHDILALGPLTNLAILSLARPDLLDRVGEVIWMGGSAGRGNHTPSAEFNAFADPEALQILLDRQVNMKMIDLEACRKVLIDEADVERVASGGGSKAPKMASLLGGYLDIALSRGRPTMALYDPVAAAAMVAPELFTFTAAAVTMECHGQHTRGRTVVDFLGATPNAQLATELDAPAIRELCLDPLIGV